MYCCGLFFSFFPSRNFRAPSANRREILHDARTDTGKTIRRSITSPLPILEENIELC